MSARFNIHPADSAAIFRLQQEFDLPHFIAAVLVARGLTAPDEVRRFLTPSLDRDWLNPYDIPQMAELVDGLVSVIRQGKRIVVFGDFDLDGISSTVTLTRGLRELGAQVEPFIPNRSDEGYGLTEPAILRMRETLAPECVITVDCGISCRNEVASLKAAGIQVFVTDHHEKGDAVPQGVPVVDPKIYDDCPSAILAGVGVALKVIQAVGGRLGKPELWRDYIDFATLGTIADLMPMRGENRALVAEGIRMINEHPRPCLTALLDIAGAAGKLVASSNLGFTLIPRLNAAGRMGDPMRAFNLLMCDDLDSAYACAETLEATNDERRAIEAELVEVASLQAAQKYHGQRVLVLAGEGWHEGVKGIVAGRIAQNYGVPTLLFTIDENGEAHGSGRVVGEVNLFKAVESAADLLTRFGGHEAAVGITLPADKLDEFDARLCAYMDDLPAESFHPRVSVDACVSLDELTLANVYRLDELMPYGQENEQPMLLARNVMLANCRAVGADKTHFSCQLTDGTNSISSIMFHCGDIDLFMRCSSVVNAAFTVQVDEWRGRRSVKAMLKALAPVQPCAALEACLNDESLAFVSELYGSDDADLIEDACEGAAEVERIESVRAQNRAEWEFRAASNPASTREAVVRAFIGEGHLHAAQAEALDWLDAGESTLAVMATGRGKSLIFQVHAVLEALRGKRMSIFVYPLRALIADQAFHLNRALERFGVSCTVLTGDTRPDERVQTFAAIARGDIDIVLTTPEFLARHVDSFARAPRLGFVVIDEAHHIGLAKAGHRAAYHELHDELCALGNPLVLALTATADDEIAADISTELGIGRHVYDRHERENLKLDDQRGLRKRGDYLANLVARGEKTVIYVNSRAESVALARHLRTRVPQLASLIGFYNAGLSREERTRIEEMFRRDRLCVLVATSAFGEGVDIPNIRHAVLFHLPFNEVEFNQMCGRVGRDGREATIHLLFGRGDRQVNETILRNLTPGRDVMAQVYRALRARQRVVGDAPFEVTAGGLAADASSAPGSLPVSPEAARCGIAVFRELDLIRTGAGETPGEMARYIYVPNSSSKVELSDSVRYREGLEELDIFERFGDWVLNASPDALRRAIIRPILPGCGYGFYDTGRG